MRQQTYNNSYKDYNKDSRLLFIFQVFLVAIALLTLFIIMIYSSSSNSSSPTHISFIGEYSYDNINFNELTSDSNISASNNDIFIRGHFSEAIPQGQRVYFYRNHVGLSISINDYIIYRDETYSLYSNNRPAHFASCGQEWNYFLSNGIDSTDAVFLSIHNPHPYANEMAYRDLLDTLYITEDGPFEMQTYLERYSAPLHIIGLLFIIIALIFLGISLAANFLHINISRILWRYGLANIFMGCSFLLDTINISFICRPTAFITYGKHLCIMLVAHYIGMCINDCLSGRLKKLSTIAMTISSIFDCMLIIVSLLFNLAIYNTIIYWTFIQLILCPLNMTLCLAELHSRRNPKKMSFLVSGIIQSGAMLLDIAGVGETMYSMGTCSKLAFLVVLVYHIIMLFHSSLINQHASERAKALEQELEDSRISIMLSQMQPHFIYNVLNTIYYLCKKDPVMAQDAVDKFSDYLRNNMSALEKSELIPFSQELKHIESYLSLELIRFKSTLTVEYDIQVSDFMLPPLTVQPLVENAVRHGVTKKRGGGTVRISTTETFNSFRITVEDTGRGFNPATYMKDNEIHIGINNVHKRLVHMIGGTLSIDSTEGVGTIATVTIPKHLEKGLT